MQLGFGLHFEQLYDTAGLAAVDAAFARELAVADIAVHNRLMTARAILLSEKEESQLLIDVAPHAEDFLAALFGVQRDAQALAEAHHALAPLYACKRLFVQRRAAKAYSEAPFRPEERWEELAFSRAVLGWMEDENAYKAELDAALAYAAWALYSEEGRHRHRLGVLFKLPQKLNPSQLVPVATEVKSGVTMLKGYHHRPRNGFALTDEGGTLEQAMDHAHYCIYCHNQGRDSCSKGFKEKDGSYRVNPQGVTLTGCPLEEKISEMNYLKGQGLSIGALAVVCVDNPLCAGTGHRICNDCMKACIYQKQEPVNIPLVETRTLDDVLALPWGFEIYSLLTRWNPLNIRRPVPRPETGKRVLVAGMGPAGYTLSHHLLNDGHTVVGIDGLKIEPLPETVLREPVRDIAALWEPLDSRIMGGFGGVAEYGITVRWDKNYLKIIRLLLERRISFALAGGVRFGGTVTRESAFALGFDHIALCLGAGRPTVLNIPGGLAKGVRTASDFLMGLQLGGAAKANSIANLQLRLPVVVIGGGLTAIDTATEALAYYPVQVEKFLCRYEVLGEVAWNSEERVIAEEFIAHARTLRATPQEQWIDRLNDWGGVIIAYRKNLSDAPSYRLNHEEIEKALEEGIRFAENLSPVEFRQDEVGWVSDVVFEDGRVLPARSVLIAAGTQPNTVLAREDAEHFAQDGRYFQAVNANGQPTTPEPIAKPAMPEILLEMRGDGRGISFLGDLHPSFAGNVVKAMGSAKQGYPVISKLLEKVARSKDPKFLQRMREYLSARVHAVNRLTPTIVEVVIHAPLAAKEFKPGQFYRLQNFESHGALGMEGLALTGASADAASGLISLIVLEMGGSSRLVAKLMPGEPVSLMGPTGAATEIPRGENVLLVGGGLGNAVLFSIGRAMRTSGCRVLYFAGYRQLQDRYKVEEIEAAADVVVWCCDEAPGFKPTRRQDKSIVGNMVQAIAAYAKDEQPIPLSSITRILAIGSDRMMAAVAEARHGVLKPYLHPQHVAIGSINSPMQCMMKEICAQCLQAHRNLATGEISYVFSCTNQDQCLDRVVFAQLAARLAQNNVQEKLTDAWVTQTL